MTQGAKHSSGGDETPPIPEEELEQQKIEHECQVQKEKERQAREAEEVKKLDIELLHQRAIEAKEEQKREEKERQAREAEEVKKLDIELLHQRAIEAKEEQKREEKERQAREAEEVKKLDIELLHQRAIEAKEEQKREIEAVQEQRGMNTSWSHHRLCDLQRQAARWRHSRPSIPDTSKPFIKSAMKKACSAQLTKPQSTNSIDENDGIFINLSRLHSADENIDEIIPTCSNKQNIGPWHSSTSDVTGYQTETLARAPSCPGCRAPIASLDCMDDFSANSQQMLDQAGHMSVYMGNPTNMPSTGTPGLRYKNLGKSGLRVPNVGLGLWSLYGNGVSDEISEEIINVALENGINLFDLSEAHCAKAETELGRILKKKNLKRTSIIITTKVYWSTKSDERGLSRKHIVESVKTSLMRLQLDYIDVVLLHKLDPLCPMEELVRTMNFLISQGLVMYWGTARWSPSEIMDAYTNCRQFNCVTPVVEQTEYHMFCREKVELHMTDLYYKIGVGLMSAFQRFTKCPTGLMAWSAITSSKAAREEVSALFAKSRFNRKFSTFSWCDDNITATEQLSTVRIPPSGSKEQVSAEEPRTYGDKLRELTNLASSLDCSMTQLAIAWCLKNESVHCLLLGATSVEQLRENIHALQIVPQLTVGVMTEIERVLANKPQRPPMVSTLAMRNQQQNANNNGNTVRIDMTGGTSGGASPKLENADTAEEEAAATKDRSRTFCEIQ